MLNFDHARFDYEPYPIGVARPVFEPGVYDRMVDGFPDLQALSARDELGLKYDLSERRTPKVYDQVVNANPVWREFRDYIQRGPFIREALAMLAGHNLDLGVSQTTFWQRMQRRWKNVMKRRPLPAIPTLTARFDFNAMPVTGGHIRPHTDIPSKIVTMVLPMVRDGEWDASQGGGTSVVLPKDRTKLFNQLNSYMDFDEVDEVRTYPFEANQALVFIKTYNSWHAVWPMRGNDPDKLRRNLTINIEAI